LKYNIIAINHFLIKGKDYAANIFTGYVSYDCTLKNTPQKDVCLKVELQPSCDNTSICLQMIATLVYFSI